MSDIEDEPLADKLKRGITVLMTSHEADRLMVRAGAELEQLATREAQLKAALEWYAERARSLAEKDWKNNPGYAEAIFVELSLDGGRRAASVEGRNDS